VFSIGRRNRKNYGMLLTTIAKSNSNNSIPRSAGTCPRLAANCTRSKSYCEEMPRKRWEGEISPILKPNFGCIQFSFYSKIADIFHASK
jgi:hypothetical protein